MISRVVRKALLAGLSLSTALVSAGIGAPQAAHAQRAGACIVSGSIAISPGLNVVLGPESMTFTGNSSPCEGIGVVAGGFGGSISCSLGGIVTCVPFANLTITSSPYGGCSGVVMFLGPYIEAHCTAGTGAIWFYWFFTSNNGIALPINSANFTGYADGAQA